MALRTYQNFDLLLEAADDGDFRARVTTSPLGQSSSAKFTLPFGRTELEMLLRRLGSRDSGELRQASMDLGGPLFESVFSEDIMLTWQRSQDYARDHGDGLRLRLRLTDAPAIAGLPWELLYDGATTASSPSPSAPRWSATSTCRSRRGRSPSTERCGSSSSSPHPPTWPSSTSRPSGDGSRTRSPPRGRPGRADRPATERRRSGPVGLAAARRRPRPALHRARRLRRADLRDGVMYFQDRVRARRAGHLPVLGPYLRDHDPLRLVVLNACRSARVDSTDPFGGMAQGLVQQDCTAVVAMQFPISDGAAAAFTGEFYGALADGLPVDQAVTSARKALHRGVRRRMGHPGAVPPRPRRPAYSTTSSPNPQPTAGPMKRHTG